MKKHQVMRPAAPRVPLWAVLALAVVVLVAYANSLNAPLAFDDIGTIVNNATIRDAGDLGAIVSPPAGTAVSGRPLVNATFALNYVWGGVSPWGYHAVNMALHLACGLLLLAIGLRTFAAAGLGGSVWPPLIAATVWLAHPLNTEAVTYVTQRTEVLMALCLLTALYAAIRAVDPLHRRRWQMVALVACVAGALAKETIAVVPILILLWDRAFVFTSWREAWDTRGRFYLALTLTWLVLGVMLMRGGQTTSGGFASAEVTPWAYFLSQPDAILRYLWLTVWPVPLVSYYGWAPQDVSPGDVWPALAMVTTLGMAAIAVYIRAPKAGFAAVAFFVLLGPSSSFIPVATEVAAERRMYLPLAVVVMGLAAGGAWLVRRQPASGRVLTAVAGAAVVALTAGTVLRHRDYGSALTLAETTLERWPTPAAHQLVGVELAVAGRKAEAVTHLREAARTLPIARYFLATELISLNQFDEAADALEAFVRDEPSLPVVPRARLMLARIHASRGEEARAVEQVALALEADPRDAAANGVMADIKIAREDFAGAVPHYQVYLRANARDGRAWNALGVALARTGRVDEAAGAFRQAVAADPADAEYRANLAQATRTGGRP
jgi:hypothetical protein